MIKKPHAKSHIAVIISIFIAISSGISQTTIWSDNFDAPAGGANNNNAGAGWTLNTEGSTNNSWFINTPSGIGCTSSGNVLHISCTGFLCGFLGGPNEPLYLAVANLSKTAISPSISTLGQSNLTLTFEFICEGSAGTDFGTLSLSGDGGTSWNDLPGEYSGVSSCSTKTITIPAIYENIANLKMRFKWQESDASDGFDPPFSVDNIRITTPNTGCTPPTVNAGTGSAICAGASVNIGGSPTATGGSGNGTYTYAWTPAAGLSSSTAANPTANPSVTTTYNLVVTQGGAVCTGTGSVTITVNPAIIPTFAPISPICSGSAAPILPTTSDNGISGTWSPSAISNTTTGNYTFTPSSNTCATTATLTVTVNTSISPTFAPINPICSGTTAPILPTTSTNGITGTWNPSIVNNTLTTTYLFTPSSNQCATTATLTVSVVTGGGGSLNITPAGPIESCQGQNVVLTAQAGLSNYEWSNGSAGNNSITVAETGGYSVSAIDANGCTLVSGIVDVSINSLPVANFTFVQTFTTEYQVQFTNTSSSADAYLWNFGGNNTSIEQNPLFTFAFDNLWPVTLTVTNNCGTSTATISVNVIKTSINDLPGFNSFNVGPNPGNDFLVFSGVALANKKINIKIYDILGKLQVQKQVQVQGNFNEILNTQSLSKGMYLVEVESDKVVATQKWIKQ